MLKSRLAFIWSADAVLGSKVATFWTFTHPQALDYNDFRKAWNRLLTYLRRRFANWSGIRVFEAHPGHPESDYHHGLHVHFIAVDFFDVFEVRRVIESAGWGRVHVAKVRDNERCGSYLAKYLAKSKRSAPLKGWRLWSTVNFKGYVRVGDVIIDSPSARVYRYLWRQPFFAELNFFQKAELAIQVLHNLAGSYSFPNRDGSWPDRECPKRKKFVQSLRHALPSELKQMVLADVRDFGNSPAATTPPVEDVGCPVRVFQHTYTSRAA